MHRLHIISFRLLIPSLALKSYLLFYILHLYHWCVIQSLSCLATLELLPETQKVAPTWNFGSRDSGNNFSFPFRFPFLKISSLKKSFLFRYPKYSSRFFVSRYLRFWKHLGTKIRHENLRNWNVLKIS